MKKLLALLNLTPDDYFCDFGCGHGLPNVLVHSLYGLSGCQNLGIERELELINYCNAYNLPINFIHKDILHITRRSLKRVSVVWAFSKVFTPKTFQKMKFVVESLPKVRALISSEKLAKGRTVCQTKYWSAEAWVLVGKFRSRMAGSRESFTLYV